MREISSPGRVDIKGSILIIGNFLSAVTGSRGVCEDLSEKLRNAGWSVLITSRVAGRMARLLDMLSVTWRNRRYYELAQMDVFSGRAFIWAEMVGFLLRWLRKPYILTLHGGNLPEFSKRMPRRVSRFLRAAKAVTTPSNYLLETMRPYREDMVLIPNPLNISRYKFILRNGSRPVLIWLRAFDDIYNPTMAVRILAELVDKYPSVRLLMGGGDRGDGTYKRTMRLAKDLGVFSQVEFCGKIPNNDVPDWLQSGDIFINTTNADNTPISVLEAMVSGLPVVSTNVGGIPFLLEDGKDALLVPANDYRAMALAVDRILESPELSIFLSNNARRKASRFDWAEVLPAWEELITGVLEAGVNGR